MSAKEGRPTDYKPEYCEQARKLCLLGATDVELSDFFEVTEKTLNNWKSTHPEFLQSIKEGKELADATVASKLYHRATGYQHEDVDIKVIDGDIVKTKLIKHYPPDTVAGIFWLKNRQKAKWRDKQEIDHTTKGNAIGNGLDLSKLSDDELRTLAELQRKSGTGEA